MAADINAAAIECILSWVGQSVPDMAGMEAASARGYMPSLSSTYDIPASAYRKIQPYNRNLGVW